jgi:hypothetical protein
MTTTTETPIISLADFHLLLRAQNVPREHMAFHCPMCGTLQSATDLIKAGAGTTFDDVEKYLAFSCVGRFTHMLPPPRDKTQSTQIGCNWTLGGFFPLCDLIVRTPDGKTHPTFKPATPEQAQAHQATHQ